MPAIKKHETIVDFAMTQLKTVEGLFALAVLNGVGITDEFDGGEEMQLPVLPQTISRQLPLVIKTYEPANDFRVLKTQQNNTDFVCQHWGSLESLFEMALLNDISITELPQPGQQLKAAMIDEKVVSFFINARLDISSNNETFVTTPGGIGYMKIVDVGSPVDSAEDFIVS